MQARVNQQSRYGRVSAFSGMEYVKFEWRYVPPQFEDSARQNEYLELREGKAEKEIVIKQAEEAIKPVMKVRLIASYKDDSVRTLSGREYVKTEWREVPAGFENSARNHELLEIWEAGQTEPTVKSEVKPQTPRTYKKKVISDKGDE